MWLVLVPFCGTNYDLNWPLLRADNNQATVTAEQETKQGVEGILATITQSRSTNTRGYRVVIHNDGSATAEIGGAGFGPGTEPSRSQRFLLERSI